MNELELYVDSLDPSLSNEEKVRLVKEWKKANKWGEQEVEVSETVELEEVDLGAVKKKDGVPGAVAPSMGPQQAPKPVTEFGLEDTFSASPEPEITYNIDGKDVSKDEWKSYLDKEEKKREAAEMDWLDRLGLSFELGSIDLGKMAASIPETLYDIASIPQNLAADPDSYPIALRPYMKALKAKGYLDFETSSKSFKEEEGLSNPILDYYEEEAKKLQNVVDIYDNENYDSKSIYENFKKGSYSDGFKLLAQGITRSAPVSLSMMAGGAVTTTGKLAAGSTVGFAGPEISEELTSKPGQSELLSIINGLGMGAAEAIWESVGTSTLGKVYKDIISKEGLEAGNKIFKEGLIDMYRTALVKYGAPVAMVEGGVQEVGTKITQNMIKGLPTFEGVNDAFIQGVGGSGLYSSPINIVKSRAAIKQGITNNKINKELKQTDFDKASQAFNPEFKTTGFEIKASQIPGSLQVIDAEVDVDLSKGDITQEQADGIKLRAREVQGATNKLKPLGISIENQPAIVDLMIEQKNLKNTIKQVNNTSLTKAESSRLTEIDTELGALITKDKAAKIDVGAKKIAEQIGVGFESFETQEDVDSAIATLQEEGGEIDTKNSDNYGTFITLPGDRSIIILNKETATEDNQFAVGEHETGHAVVYETVKNKPDAAIALGQSLLNELRTNKNINIKPEFQQRLDQYVEDADVSEADTMEEVMTLASEGLSNGTIEINETIGVKLGNYIRRALSAMGMKVKFKNGKDVLNFIKDYNRSIHRQKGLSRGLKKTAIEGAEVSITPETVAETEIKESVAKESKRKQETILESISGLLPNNIKTKKEFDTWAQSEKGGKVIADALKPGGPISNYIRSRGTKQESDRMLDDVLFRIYNFNPEAKRKDGSIVGPEAFGEKIFADTAWAKVTARTKLFEEGEKAKLETRQDDTTKQLVDKGKKEKAVKTDDLPLKPTETTTFNPKRLTPEFIATVEVQEGQTQKDAIEDKITETIIEGYKDRDVKTFKDLGSPKFPIPRSVAKLYADMFGIKTVDALIQKQRNLQKFDEPGAIRARQFLIDNALSDYQRFPGIVSGLGKSTSVLQTKLGSVMYNKKGKKVGTIKNYIDIISGKEVTLPNFRGESITFNARDAKGKKKDIYRDAQHIKAAIEFHIKNRALETTMPDQGKRIQAGAKFSKRQQKSYATRLSLLDELGVDYIIDGDVLVYEGPDSITNEFIGGDSLDVNTLDPEWMGEDFLAGKKPTILGQTIDDYRQVEQYAVDLDRLIVLDQQKGQYGFDQTAPPRRFQMPFFLNLANADNLFDKPYLKNVLDPDASAKENASRFADYITDERLKEAGIKIGGAKFSKKIKTPKQTSKFMQDAAGKTRVDEKQEGTKRRPDSKKRDYDRNKLLSDSVKAVDGETVIQGFDRVLNKFLNKNPKFNNYLKFSLVFGESRSPYGIVSRFNERLDKTGEQADIRRTPMTKDKMVTNSYVEAISKPGYVAKENAKLDLLKDFYLAAEKYLKNNPKDTWVFDGIASAATNSQNAPLRALAPALIIEVDSNGKAVRNKKGIEEHSKPQNNIGTTLTNAAKEGRVNEVWPVIEASYMQGWITLENNDLLDVDFKSSMPDLFWKAVELFKEGKIKVDRGLLSTIRFTEAGINLDNLLYIPTGQTISEYFFGVKGLQQDTQAELIRDYFSGEKTLEQIKEYAKDESKLSKDKAKASKRMNELMPSEIKYDKPISVQMGVDALAKSDKALNNARRPDAPIKKIRVFDFDDTLARSKSKVLYTVPNVEGGFSEGATKLKAIFMVGGPGAGKTNVGKGLQLGRRGYKVVNQDIALEAMKEEAGLPAKESDYTAEQRSTRSKLGAAARKAAVAKFDKYAENGLGMVIDGTGASYNATTKKIKALEDKGYEVHMVVATTPLETAIERNKARTERSLPDFVVKKTYDQVQESLAKYREDFGDRLYEINTETIEYGKPLPNDFLQQVYAGINTNKVGKVDATSFAENYDVLESQGAEFDFREFSKVIEGEKGPLFSVAEKIAAARGTDDVFILTARPADAAVPIQEFMKANGVDIPLANITGLGDGTAEAKAGWIMGKAAEGYNDFYFADDAIKNVKAVKNVLSQVDVKSKVQQAKASKRIVFDKVFNDIIEQKVGIESYKQFSAAKAKTVGASKGKFTFFTTPSAEDFLGLLYKTLGKGKVGDAQMAFYKTNLLDPYNRAEIALSQAKVSAGRDYKALKKQFKNIPKTLEKETGIAKYTYQHAIRTYIWNKQGIEVPGLSKRDQKRLTDFIANDAELSVFADNLITIQKDKPYPKPEKDWTAGTITTDVIGGINKVNRKEYLQEWQENVDIIFSEKNINKLEAAFGAKYVEALKDSLRAMKSGSNRPLGGDRVSDGILDWLNNSVGAIMFLNTRSAVLQTISAVNFINWGDNNILNAGKAFANQKQFWDDFLTLMNSDYLLERRDGLKINVSESEIADAVQGSKNKVNAAISFLLNKGFVFTRYADSFAIASGGATFYRNRTEALVEQGMDRKAAEEQAFNDFRAIAEENQQSSSPSKISQQQRSLIGRIILQFGNTQLQYVRIQKRAVQDLVNKRGDWKSNISKIVYYGAMQNLLFNALQSGLAWALFDDDEDDEELTEKNKEQKFERTINGAIDSQLKGLGIQGAVVSGIKNALMTIAEQADKKSPKFEEALDDLLSTAPALGSKIRKLKSAARTVSWNRKEIKEKGFSMDNPAYLAGAQVISAAFNIPLDRAVMKMNNMRNILNPATENWQKVALALGWSGWDVGLPYFGLAEDKPVLTETEKKTQKLFDLNKSDQVKMLLDLGLTKKKIRALTKEEQRVQEIIKLQNKNKDGK